MTLARTTRILFLFMAAAAAVLQPVTFAEENRAPRILSAGLGDSLLPPAADFALCPPPARGTGYGGMPVVFSHEIDPEGGVANAPFGLDPHAFEVRVRGGDNPVTPLCATLLPAFDNGERRTVLLTGEFGNGGHNRPVAVRVVGDVRTVDGQSLRGLSFRGVSDADGGPSLVLAERYVPGDGIISTSPADDDTQGTFCPAGQTAVVIKLTFSGGMTAINGGPLQDDPVAMAAIQLAAEGENGRRIYLTPFALRDVDNDNYLDACFAAPAADLNLLRIAVDSHVFYNPSNAPGGPGAVDID